ncbi:uncharacterized protein LOC116343578 [Contarinia nasturtii]|uniref:uncharacterized protein LOC116343578 n=1 Tax=Contarinia nasturtii TaxID=265458 RepID=UPI0012D493F4|nr:uncharacterized protein LOC116343578 [Contarinia nasturtii]
MTILTKPNAGAKTNPKTVDASSVENGAINEQDENGNNDKLFLLRERTRRFTGSTLLLILATFCLMCMGFLIGLVVYRRVQLQRMRFHGMCNLPYDGNFDDNRDILNAMNAMNQKFHDLQDYSADSLQSDLGLLDDRNDDIFREEFDLGLSDDDSYAKINVPDFRDGRVGRFLHDFKYNQTAIIDESAKRCFVMPLDRETILPPKSLADLILKMYMGEYDINTTSIRKNMRVVLPALTDLSTISLNIQLACDSMDIYLLDNYVGGIVKRSAELVPGAKFTEFTGNYINYNIMNIEELNRN